MTQTPPSKLPISTSGPQVAVPQILDISPYKPGTSKTTGNNSTIKLSSNENPFGCSAQTLEAMIGSVLSQHRYPDGGSSALTSAIAARYNLDAQRIVCGAGSDELLALLCQAYAGPGDEVLYTEHGFLMYPISALRVGATPVKAPETNKSIDITKLLGAVTEKTKIVFIANPNNPTGSYIPRKKLLQLRQNLPEHVLLVIDAAYAEYVENSDYTAGADIVDGSNNTVMTRTFSKIHGLGGIRLGWAYCPPEIADILHRIRGPFNVASMAQAAGIAALQSTDFEEQSRQHNTIWLKKMAKGLKSLGLTVYPSVANFILVEFKSEHDANAAYSFLQEQGILVRAMQSYGLPSCLRITIGATEENEAVLEALQHHLQN